MYASANTQPMGIEFGRRLRDRRKEKQLSLEKLGELTDMTKGTISNYETGKRDPGGEAAAKLARALETTSDYLLTGQVSESAGGRVDGEQLFLEDIEARTPHRLPAAREWLEKKARRAQYIGTEGWGRVVWFRRLLEDWNEHRKGTTAAGAVAAQPVASTFEDRRREALERKRLKDEGGE